MSCIVGVVSAGRVYIGADSAGVEGWALTVRKDRKVFRVGEFVIGFTTSFRMGQLLAHAFKPPKVKGDLDRYMTVDFVGALRATFKAHGWSTNEKGQEAGGTFLVGVRGRLFSVESDYQVGEAVDGFHAVGCGAEAARGALFALTDRTDARSRVTVALRAAERLSAGVRAPFHMESTP